MRITVTLFCRHEDGFSDHRDEVGQHAVISLHGVILDGKQLVWRDRRAKKNREPGHPWVSSPSDPVRWAELHPERRFEAWTGFSVRVEP